MSISRFTFFILVAVLIIFPTTAFIGTAKIKRIETSKKSLQRTPASPLNFIFRMANSSTLTLALLSYTLYDLGTDSDIDFLGFLERMGRESTQDENKSSLPLNSNYSPMSDDQGMEVLPKNFSNKSRSALSSRPKPSENINTQNSKILIPKREEDLRSTVYSKEESALRKHFTFTERHQLLHDSLSEARNFLQNNIHLKSNEIPLAERALRMSDKVQFLEPGDRYASSLVPDFETCKAFPNQAAFPLGQQSTTEIWSLAICHTFHELSNVDGRAHTPAHLGGKIIAYIMLSEAGMEKERLVQLIFPKD